MIRFAEPTKVCSCCKQRKPFSDFHARKRDDAGIVITVQSRCKLCDRAYRDEWSKSQPDRMRKYWRNDYAREREKALRGAAERKRERNQRLEAAPFREWLERLLHRDREEHRPGTPTDLARRLGISARSVSRILGGSQCSVTLELVERAIQADDTTTLDELYGGQEPAQHVRR